jgi:hypothetical protein
LNTAWKEALQNKYFVYSLLLTLLSLGVLGFFMPYFFGEVIAGKPGFVLDDFILERLSPRNWSWPIFILVYSCTLLTLATNYRNPRVIWIGLATYSGVTWLRMLTIYLVTLEVPKGIIFLIDPFLSLVVYPGKFGKDLFFSGHISAMTVYILIEPNKPLKYVKIAATVITAYLILAQHVHYAVDIFFAPLFAYGIYRLLLQFQNASARLR